jgi:hypothetical protein
MAKTLSSNDLKYKQPSKAAKPERKRIRSAAAVEKIIHGLGGKATHDQLTAGLITAGALTPKKLKEF